MKYKVRFISNAKDDLFEIYKYIASTDLPSKAEKILEQLEFTCNDLETSPLRGRVPPELQRIGITQYREKVFKAYRIIYTIQGKTIYVHCILDSRRNLQELLFQRLTRESF